MAANVSSKEMKTGFLSILGNDKQGLMGGFLVLNCFGRPVEFHCTAPIRANRAQEILYGNTLQPFLYGEQIARTLIEHAESKLLIVLTDSLYVLSAAALVHVPVGFVFSREEDAMIAGTATDPEHLPVIPGLDLSIWRIAEYHGRKLLMPIGEIENVSFEERFENFMQSIDPLEPFERIQLAIQEAQKTARHD